MEQRKQVLSGLKEIGAFLGVSRRTAGELIKKEKLPARRVGKGYISTPLLIERWISGEG
jgi:hypothetical protein